MKEKQLLARLFLMALMVPAAGCWILLPEETAIIVRVLDERGTPVDGIQVTVGGTTLPTGQGGNPGEVFRSLSLGGTFEVAIDPASLTDPQGGIRWVPLAAQISGEAEPLSIYRRDFAFPNSLAIPVETGKITQVTIHLADLLVSPKDNQWLTDGDHASRYRSGNGSFEYQGSPAPTFWWREDASFLASDRNPRFTFQLWEDPDGDIRYPLGVVNAAGYLNTVEGTVPYTLAPDWEVPLAGLQRAKTYPATDAGRVFLWWGPASGATAVSYDLYWAQTALWDDGQWENNQIVRGISTLSDGGAVYALVGWDGGGYPANKILFKNGTSYTFGIRARDASANIDSVYATNTRRAAPPPGTVPVPYTWTNPNLSAYVDSTLGGAVRISFDPISSTALSYRIYAYPPIVSVGNSQRRFSEVYIRKVISSTGSGAVSGTVLSGLVNGSMYQVGVEPIDSQGNIAAPGVTAYAGTLKPMASALAGCADTTRPVMPGDKTVVADAGGAGQAILSFNQASDVSTLTYRIYYNLGGLPGELERYRFLDFAGSDLDHPGSGTYDSSLTIGGLVNGVTYTFQIVALDAHGNRPLQPDLYTLVTFAVTKSSSLFWATDDASLFSGVIWAVGGSPLSRHQLGWRYDYDGFALRRDKDHGEYVWRIKQRNPDLGLSRSGKLGAFYTYDGYYFHSADPNDFQARLRMTNVSANVRHQTILSAMDNALAYGTIMGAYFASPNNRLKQKTASDFAGRTQTDPSFASVNQVMIRYRTNLDGKAIDAGDGHTAFLDVQVTDRTVNNAVTPPFATPPYLRSKVFELLYNRDLGSPFRSTDNLVHDVGSPTGFIRYSGSLESPDLLDPEGIPFQDPAW